MSGRMVPASGVEIGTLGSFLGVPIERHPSLGSTNDEAMRRADEGAPEGLVVVADVQTAGRGRQGRGWRDVPGVSLAFSVLLRPAIPMPQYPLLSLAVACAVAEAGEAITGAKLSLKWPNDVLHEGRKLCGILAESRIGAGEAAAALVIGTGVNVDHASEDFPSELRDRATSLRIAAGGRRIGMWEALGAILPRFEGAVLRARAGDTGALWEAAAARLPAPGTPVRVRSGTRIVEGVVEGLTETGALRLREPGRAEATVVTAGEIEP